MTLREESMSAEWSVVYDLSAAAETVKVIDIAPDAGELQALAKRFALKQLTKCSAQLTLTPHVQGYQVSGTIGAEVTQSCVVSGVDVPSVLDVPIHILLWQAPVEADLDALEDAYEVDEIEQIEGNEYDLGELCAQYLGLAIDPFVRAEGASLDAAVTQASTSPFSILQGLKDKA